jgi:hypothetical protein
VDEHEQITERWTGRQGCLVAAVLVIASWILVSAVAVLLWVLLGFLL